VRTAEELGRAFPGVPVLTSTGTSVLRTVPDRPVLVVATPGAEPVAPASYRAALLLDAWALLARPSLRAQDEALRRWMNAAALVRPAAEGGRVVVAADPGARSVQALIRWDPVGYATRELAERQAAQLPPAVHLVEVMGAPEDVARFLDAPGRPAGLEILGPLPAYADGTPPAEPGLPSARAVLRIGLARRGELLHWIRAALAARSARKEGGPLRVRVDPTELS
jgi:primosomal protein N' (replication factor Y)